MNMIGGIIRKVILILVILVLVIMNMVIGIIKMDILTLVTTVHIKKMEYLIQ